MTDDDGAYRFTDLPAGTYEVREEHPAAWIDGQEMLTSSTVNDTYSNIVLTPGQQAADHSFGERTLQPQFISKRQFLASTPVTEVYLRELNALAKQRAGDAAGAQAIRDASIPSVVSANSTASARLAQDASPDVASDVASDEAPDEASLAAGESTPVAPETAPGGEGEATMSSVPPAALAVREAAAGLDATPAKATIQGASSTLRHTARVASRANAGDGSRIDGQSGSRQCRFARGCGTRRNEAARCSSTGDLRGFLQRYAQSPRFPGDRKNDSPGIRRDSGSAVARQIAEAKSSGAPSPRVDRPPGFRSRPSLRPRETDQNLDTAQLVDLVFADDAWLDRP